MSLFFCLRQHEQVFQLFPVQGPPLAVVQAQVAVRPPLVLARVAHWLVAPAQLLDVLDTLTPREEKVLRLRFGLDDGHQRTLEEVGREFKVTRERIRQIEAKALRKLRQQSRSKNLRVFLD